MKQRPRIYYSDAQKALMWDRWQKGESLNSIAASLRRSPSSVSREIKRNGGRRCYRASHADQAAGASTRLGPKAGIPGARKNPGEG